MYVKRMAKYCLGNLIVMFYFSYGSNMSTRRLKNRIGDFLDYGRGELFGHRLTFDKYSFNDGTGKCDAEFTANPNDSVHGVIFEISEDAKAILDEFEGLGKGYRDKIVRVETPEGHRIRALTYVAIEKRKGLKPLKEYKDHVLTGAYEHALPDTYIRKIHQIDTAKQDGNKTDN